MTMTNGGQLDLTEPEAALLATTLVSFADDDPSEAEGVVLRTYYRLDTAESAQAKLTAAGVSWPSDLAAAEPQILNVLKDADERFRLRTVAAAWKVAQADGTIDQREMTTLNRIAGALGIALADGAAYADSDLREIDETGSYHDNPPLSVAAQPVAFTADEATFVLAAEVSFADDDPSDAEVAVIREHCGAEVAASAMARMADAGYSYPDDLAVVRGEALRALGAVSRDHQVRSLAVAWATAEADGTVVADELALMRELCEHYVIGLAEVRQYFRATPEG